MLYIAIILTWLVWCVTGRPLPCTIVDEKHGSMLCCDYQPLPHEEGLSGIKVQSNEVIHSDKKCTLMTPKASLGLLKEVWSLKNYTWASGMLKTKFRNTKDIPRHKECCCEEQFVFSIHNEGISAQTGKTHKIVQQDHYVQPTLSLLCQRKSDCHTSGNFKVFQRMEAHSQYVESEDHPEYVHEELLLKPSGCLCLPHILTVKPDIGEILLPMDLIEEAMTDSRIVKRNAEYPTELPEILRLALEIMREPNPLPVLNSIERQMALQLQQTRYFTALAMASGLPGGFGPNNRNPYDQNQQGNATQADIESLKAFPIHTYQLILSAFLSGLALGQNFRNISQIEILDRLIVDNGNSGINLLETILRLENNSLGSDYNSLEFNYGSLINITNIDSNGIFSNKTYSPNKLIDNTTTVIDSGVTSPTYVTTTSGVSSPTYFINSSLSSPTYVTTSDLYNTTNVIDSHISSPTYVTIASGHYSTLNNTTNVIDSHISSPTYVNISSSHYSTTHDTTSSVFSIPSTPPASTSAAPSVASVESTRYNEATTDASALVDSADITTDYVVYNSSDKEYNSSVATGDNIADSHVYFGEEVSTNTPAGGEANTNTLAGDDAYTHTPAGDDAYTHTPAGDDAYTNTPAGDDAYTNTPAGDDAYTNTPAGDDAYTNTPAGDDAYTNTPAGDDAYTNTPGVVHISNIAGGYTFPDEDDTTKAATIEGSTAEPFAQTSYNQDYSTYTDEIVGSSTEPNHIFYDEDTTSYNEADTADESTEPGVPTTSNEAYSTTSNMSAESEIPESTFNLHEYIMGLPQFQPLTINTDLLMHIMFSPDHITPFVPPEPIIHDERGSAV